MNCEDFNDRLLEYLEDALSTADQAAAQEHVQKCGVCQKALAHQEALSKSIRFSFHRDTQRLSLRPETKRNILNALKRPAMPLTPLERVQAFFAVLWRHPAWTGTVLVCLVLLIPASRLCLDSARRSSAQATVKEDRITCVINVPIQTEMRAFRRQNNMVVDAVVTENSTIDASFSENMRSSHSSQPPIN
jgi:hypothetical protein